MPRSAVFAFLLAGAATAQACGFCVEDKMAAVYDHAIFARTLGQKHHIALFHIEGALTAGATGKRELERLAESSAGVLKGSARASIEYASLAVAFDPQRTPVMTLQKNIERRLAAKKVSLMMLSVMDRPADFSPSVTRAWRTRQN